MAKREVPLVTNEYYHIYNRGNNKNIIFHDEKDHAYFINLLRIMNTESRVMSTRHSKRLIEQTASKVKTENEILVSVGAYCLMPNHFHILLLQEKDDGISLFMKKISTAYVMYYNKKYKHTGGLFEGRFKSKYAGEDVYLKYLFSYIHLNPLKLFDKDWKMKVKTGNTKMFKFLLTYPYSSFHEYYKNEEDIIFKKSFPNYFLTKDSFIKSIKSWISLDIT